MKKTPALIKKCQSLHLFFILLAMIGFIVSCTVQPGKESAPTPYASLQELDSITNGSSNYVYWRVSRVFSVIEMESFCDKNSWQGAGLSERPILIYDGYSKPKYYEFRVIKDGREVGSIAAAAQKADGKPVQYVMDYAKNYNVNLSIGSDQRIIAANYPVKVLFARASAPGVKISGALNTLSGENEQIPVSITALEMLTNSTPEQLSNMGLTNMDEINRMIDNQVSNNNFYSNMWTLIEQHKDEVMATSDAEISNAAANSKTKGNWDYEYVLNQWWSIRDWYNPGMWCGPNCLMFISMGDGQYWGVKNFIPGDPYKIKEVYDRVENQVGTGPKLYWDLDRPLRENTSLSLPGGLPHYWDLANFSIIANGLPALSLRTWGFINYEWTFEWHYRVICGVRREHREVGFWMSFLWWTWYVTLYAWNNDYYIMHDNGSDGGNFYESAGLGHQLAIYPVVRYK